MVFCNMKFWWWNSDDEIRHNPYFNRWFSAIYYHLLKTEDFIVTILILIDGFLQYILLYILYTSYIVTILILIDGFLQLNKKEEIYSSKVSHNPYFNRWFSAIRDKKAFKRFLRKVTILILIDGFLQWITSILPIDEFTSQSLF